jgi:hypothetical protein
VIPHPGTHWYNLNWPPSLQFSGQSALHAAAALNQSEVIVELVTLWGADINLQDHRGSTPMLLAVSL